MLILDIYWTRSLVAFAVCVPCHSRPRTAPACCRSAHNGCHLVPRCVYGHCLEPWAQVAATGNGLCFCSCIGSHLGTRVSGCVRLAVAWVPDDLRPRVCSSGSLRPLAVQFPLFSHLSFYVNTCCLDPLAWERCNAQRSLLCTGCSNVVASPFSGCVSPSSGAIHTASQLRSFSRSPCH